MQDKAEKQLCGNQDKTKVVTRNKEYRKKSYTDLENNQDRPNEHNNLKAKNENFQNVLIECLGDPIV